VWVVVSVRVVPLVGARVISPLAVLAIPQTQATLGLFARATGGSYGQVTANRRMDAVGRQTASRRRRRRIGFGIRGVVKAVTVNGLNSVVRR